jgi:hypothetical protein
MVRGGVEGSMNSQSHLARRDCEPRPESMSRGRATHLPARAVPAPGRVSIAGLARPARRVLRSPARGSPLVPDLHAVRPAGLRHVRTRIRAELGPCRRRDRRRTGYAAALHAAVAAAGLRSAERTHLRHRPLYAAAHAESVACAVRRGARHREQVRAALRRQASLQPDQPGAGRDARPPAPAGSRRASTDISPSWRCSWCASVSPSCTAPRAAT